MDIQTMERWNSLSTSEIRILRAMTECVERGDEKIPIRAIAHMSYVSTTTVIRLAKKLGYDGFSEMLYSLRHERFRSLSPDMPGFCERLIACERSRRELDALACDLRSGAFERIHIMGIGYSDLTAHYLCNRLFERGYFASTKSPLDFRDERSFLTILVSESGETRDLMFIQERVRARDAPDYVFTADESSSLGSRTRHCILVERHGCRGDRDSDYFVVNCLMLIEDLMVKLKEQRKAEGE